MLKAILFFSYITVCSENYKFASLILRSVVVKFIIVSFTNVTDFIKSFSFVSFCVWRLMPFARFDYSLEVPDHFFDPRSQMRFTFDLLRRKLIFFVFVSFAVLLDLWYFSFFMLVALISQSFG